MTRLLAFCLLALLLFACKQKGALETIENKDEAGYVERYTRRKSDFAKEGLYTRIDPQGKKVEEALYKNDTLDGWRILYYETGDTQVLESYKTGLFHGIYKVYFPEGGVKLLGQYADNEMTGLWKGYYENGSIKEEVTFEKSEENGPFVEYYPNGKLKAQGNYLNGDYEHGELKLYDEAGQLIKTMQCDKGICRTTWEAKEGTAPN